MYISAVATCLASGSRNILYILQKCLEDCVAGIIKLHQFPCIKDEAFPQFFEWNFSMWAETDHAWKSRRKCKVFDNMKTVLRGMYLALGRWTLPGEVWAVTVGQLTWSMGCNNPGGLLLTGRQTSTAEREQVCCLLRGSETGTPTARFYGLFRYLRALGDGFWCAAAPSYHSSAACICPWSPPVFPGLALLFPRTKATQLFSFSTWALGSFPVVW